MSAAAAEAQQRWSVDRFSRFKSRPEIKRIATKYAQWAESQTGIMTMVTIALFRHARAAGRINTREYKAALKRLAADARIPVRDLRLIADCQQEIFDCAQLGSGERTVII